MKSFFLSKINEVLFFTQRKFQFLSEGSFFIKKIDYFIAGFAFLSLFFSLFATSSIIGLCVLVGFFFLLLKYFIKPKSSVEIDAFDFFVILYVLIFCLATVFSSWFIFSLHGLLKVFIYFFSYLSFKDLVKSYPKLKIYFMIFIAVLVSVESFFAIIQQFLGVDMLATWQDMKSIRSDQVMNRVYGTLKPLNPNLLGGYLVVTMPALIGCTFYKFKSYKINILFFVCLIAVLFATIFTGCRGAYVAAFLQGSLFIFISGHIIWHDFKEKKWLKKIWLYSILTTIVAIAAIIFSSPALQHRLASIFTARADSSNSFRFNVYFSSIQMFLDNWLTGIGVGNWTFREVYGLYMLTGYDALGAYSVPLEIAVETGVFGLLNFISLIVLSFLRTFKIIFAKITYNQKVLASVCFISIAGAMMHGIVDTIWFRPQVQLVFWLMLAITSTFKIEDDQCNKK